MNVLLKCKLRSILFEHLPNIQNYDILKIPKNLSQSSLLPKWIAYYYLSWEIMKVSFPPFILFIFKLIIYLLILFEIEDIHSEICSFTNVIKCFEKSGPPRKRGQLWLPLINCFLSNTWAEVQVIIWGAQAHGSGCSWKVSSSKTWLLKVTGYWTSILVVDTGLGNIVSFFISQDLKNIV